MNGSQDMLALLLRHHADVNAPTKFEQLTPLHVAVKHKHKSAALQLIEHGADVALVDAVSQHRLATHASRLLSCDGQ